MIKYDIIGTFATYATTKGYKILYGEDWYQNYEADYNNYANGQKVLGVDFTARPIFQNLAVNRIEYNGVVMLGQKFDANGTPSSLDETFKQKYDRRLLTLVTLLETVIKEIACANDLLIGNVNVKMALNKFDTNIDFVAAEITFIQ